MRIRVTTRVIAALFAWFATACDVHITIVEVHGDAAPAGAAATR